MIKLVEYGLFYCYGTGFLCLFGVGAAKRWTVGEFLIAPVTITGLLGSGIERRLSLAPPEPRQPR